MPFGMGYGRKAKGMRGKVRKDKGTGLRATRQGGAGMMEAPKRKKARNRAGKLAGKFF